MRSYITEIKETVKDEMGLCCLSDMYKAVDKMCGEFPFWDIAELFNNMNFYVNNPSCSQEADRETILLMAERLINLISLMSSVYGNYRDLHEHMKDKRILLP